MSTLSHRVRRETVKSTDSDGLEHGDQKATSMTSLTSKEGERPRLKRQITMADDECHPPNALEGKIKEVDKLIQAETSETGRVRESELNQILKKYLIIK